MEHVVLFSSYSEDRSSIKERASDSRIIAPSTEDAEFRVVSHDRVLQPPYYQPPCCHGKLKNNSKGNVTHLFYQAIYIEVPPPEMDINGLYILITEIDNK